MFKILNEYKVTLTSLRDFSKVFSYILINIAETLILCPRCTIRNACRVIENYFIIDFVKIRLLIKIFESFLLASNIIVISSR